jgi:hypothetical protein
MFDGVDPHAIIVFGSVVAIVFITMLSSVIKTWIKKDSGSLAGNQEFLAALREFKEKTDRRLTRIEKVIDDISADKTLKEKSPQVITAKQEKKNLIDIEIENQPDETESKGKEKLKNMLD